MEDDLLAWLRAHGYSRSSSQGGDAVLTRTGAARLTKGGNRPVWEWLVANTRPKAEAQQIREDAQAARQGGYHDVQDVHEAKQRAGVRARLQQQGEQNRVLRELLARQAAHLNARLAEAVADEGQRERSRQQAQAVGVQVHAGACYREQLTRALAELRRLHARLQQAAGVAKGWAAGARGQQGPARGHPGPSRGVDPGHVAHVARACTKSQVELQARALLAMQQGSLKADPHSDLLLQPASGCAELRALSTSPDSPLLTLRAITQVMHKATAAIQGEQVSPRGQGAAGGSSGWGAPSGATSSGAVSEDPQLLLRQRQQAHVDRFYATEELLNQVEDTVRGIQGRQEAAQPLLEWPYNHLKLQEAWLQGELGALGTELQRLRRELGGRHSAEAALQEQWRMVYEASCYAQQAHSLLERLILESGRMTARWGADSDAHQAWCQGELPATVGGAASACSSGRDLVQDEVAAAGCLSLAACPPHACQPQEATAPADVASREQQQEASVLFGYSQALASTGWQQKGSSLRSSSSQGSPKGLKGRGAGAGSPAAKQQQEQQQQQQQQPGKGLALVLQAAGAMDVVAPLRCPASLVTTAADNLAALEALRLWLRAAQPHLAGAAQQVQQRALALRPLQQQVALLIRPPSDPRLDCVLQYIATAQGMQVYARDRVGRSLADWKALPAVHLLPDVQYAGLSASEWLSAVQALLSSIAEAQGVH